MPAAGFWDTYFIQQRITRYNNISEYVFNIGYPFVSQVPSFYWYRSRFFRHRPHYCRYRQRLSFGRRHSKNQSVSRRRTSTQWSSISDGVFADAKKDMCKESQFATAKAAAATAANSCHSRRHLHL